MDTVFLNLVRGTRLSNYMGLLMDEGVPYRYARDYTYVEIPLAQLYNPSTEEVVEKATRNQKLRIIPACKVSPKGTYKLLVKTNPRLQEYATCPAMFLLDPSESEALSFYALFQKDMDSRELDWAVRIYMTA
jgi:hypothetical protein